jgi:muconate cycloisomerase
MRIAKIEIFAAKIPLVFHFRHALDGGHQVKSIFVKVTLDDGTFGFGECIPREYVSGETVSSEFFDIKRSAPFFRKRQYESAEELTSALKTVKPFGVGQCALELALLDAGGKYFKKTIPQLLKRPVVKKKITYSDGIPIGPDALIKEFAALVKHFQFNHVKVKVGRGDDLGRVAKVRKLFGPKMGIGIDCNAAWTVPQAVDMIKKMQKYNIDMVEQPTKSIEGLKKVSQAVDVPVMADESLTTVESAKKLAELGACQIFNIRISKHGGLFNSLRVYEIAKGNNIKCVLGCHVGETDILAAAGRHLASVISDFLYVAGSGERFLFEENLIKEDLTFGKKGVAELIPGYGLGVHPDEKLLSKYYIQRETV